MRVLFLNRCYGADSEATGQLLAELCSDLARAHEVGVVAGPSDSSRGWLTRERVGGVDVARTWGTRLPKASLVARLANLGTYFVLAPLAAARLGRADVVVTETDPPLLGLVGAVLKRRWKCRFVYYCQDIYPDIAEVTEGIRSRALLRLLAWANGVAYASADRIVVLGEDMRRRLTAKGIPAEKIAVVANWVDAEELRPVRGGTLRAQMGGRFVVMYSGNLGLSQPLEVVLRAAERLRHDPSVAFLLIGDGARRAMLQSWARRARLENVLFLPYQPKSTLSESLGAADLHLVPLRAGLTGCLVPSKVYGILAAGRPLVALMDADADVARLVVDAGVGFVLAPDDVDGLVQTIRAAAADRPRLDEMGIRARRLAVERFDRGTAVRRFAALLEDTVESDPSLRFSPISR